MAMPKQGKYAPVRSKSSKPTATSNGGATSSGGLGAAKAPKGKTTPYGANSQNVK